MHIWLDSGSGGGTEIHREGLDEIDFHIDPTDFVAFNSYHDNLHKFATFVRHTDVPMEKKADGFENPWVVVSTTKRHPARLALMSAFERVLDTFHEGVCSWFCKKSASRRMSPDDDKLVGVAERYVLMTIYAFGIVILYWYYFAHTYIRED